MFTYAYARQLGLGRFAGTVSGIAFMFSSFMLAHVTHWTMVDTMVWLLAVLACLVRVDTTRRPAWSALAGLALGTAFLAGHPQLFYHVALATVALGLTLVARRATRGEPWGWLAGILLLVPLVSLGISAVLLIPSWEMAVAVAPSRAGIRLEDDGLPSPPPTSPRRSRLAGAPHPGLRPAGPSAHSNATISAIDQVGAATAGRMRMARGPLL